MSKLQKQNPPPPKKQVTSAKGSDTFTYLLRNFIVLITIAFILFGADRMNKKQSELNEMYQEFQQLRQNGGDQQRMQELYTSIMEIQNDTAFIKKLTRGYRWAVHDLAIGGKENVEEIKAKSDTPITRLDKFAMRVSTWPLIDYVIKNTPKDAVILLPRADSAITNNSKWNYVYHPGWMEYFLYPRLCVAIGGEKDHPGLAEHATHVLIVEGKGYEMLHYDVPMNMRPREDVLPIELPKSKRQE